MNDGHYPAWIRDHYAAMTQDGCAVMIEDHFAAMTKYDCAALIEDHYSAMIIGAAMIIGHRNQQELDSLPFNSHLPISG